MEESKKFKGKFCAVPWYELHHTSLGEYNLCCAINDSIKVQRKNVKDGVESHWNSEYMRDARLKFLEGKAMKVCELCYIDENAGKVSHRMRRNNQFLGKPNINLNDPIINDIKNQTDVDGYTKKVFSQFSPNVGNTCQLRCVDCAPAFSRSILKDYDKLNWDVNFKTRRNTFNNDITLAQKDIDMNIWDEGKKYIKNIKTIRITGGEPSISKGFLDFINWCAETGHSKNIVIFCPTNAVNVKDNFINPLRKFQSVKLEISVDGVGALDEYLRYPTNWEKKNKIIDQLCDIFPESTLHTVIYSLNLAEVEKLVEYGKSKNKLHSFQCLSWPDNLNIQHLPQKYKDKHIKIINSLITKDDCTEVYNNKLEYNHEFYRNNGLNTIVNRIKLSGATDKWDECKNIIRAYDTIRPYKLVDIVPDLKDFL